MTACSVPTHYAAAQVAAATGVSAERQCQWYDRNTIIPNRQDKRLDGPGDYRLTSLPTVYQIAITNRLAQLGINAKQAAFAARKFTDFPNPGRPAAMLFPQGRTVLCLRENGPVVINADLDADFSALSDSAESFAAIDCGQVRKSVDAILNTLNN
jgi:hypothetical protein